MLLTCSPFCHNLTAKIVEGINRLINNNVYVIVDLHDNVVVFFRRDIRFIVRYKMWFRFCRDITGINF